MGRVGGLAVPSRGLTIPGEFDTHIYAMGCYALWSPDNPLKLPRSAGFSVREGIMMREYEI